MTAGAAAARFHSSSASRQAEIRHGVRLEAFTLVYNVIEAAVALPAGLATRSVSLIGFGVDSVIESWSSLTMLWRLKRDRDLTRRIPAERRAQLLIAISFHALALYIAWESTVMLWRRRGPESSWAGILLAIASVLIMPVLARAKRSVARRIGSAAMSADARQTALCSYLSAILLAGLALNAWLGWWWADPVAALAMVPILFKEGWNAQRGFVAAAPGGNSR